MDEHQDNTDRDREESSEGTANDRGADTRGLAPFLTILLFTLYPILIYLVFLHDRNEAEIEEVLAIIGPILLDVTVILIVGSIALNWAGLMELFRSIGRRSWIGVGAIAVFGFLFVWAVSPRTHRIYYDEDIYGGIGLSIATNGLAKLTREGLWVDGEFKVRGSEYNKQPNAWPYLLSLLYRVTGPNEPLSHLLNNLAVTATIVLVFLIGWMLFSRESLGLYAALIFATLPDSLRWGNTMAVEPMATFFFAFAVFCVLFCCRRPNPERLLFLISVSAVAVQFRPETVILLGMLVFVVFAIHRPGEFLRNRFHLSLLLFLVLIGHHLVHMHTLRKHPWGSGNLPKFHFMYLWTDAVRNNPRFTKEDFTNLGELCRKISSTSDDEDPTPARRVWEFFPEQVQDITRLAASSEKINSVHELHLRTALNRILEMKDFYEREYFTDVELDDGTKQFLRRQSPRSLPRHRLRKFTRILLESSFPKEFLKMARPTGLFDALTSGEYKDGNLYNNIRFFLTDPNNRFPPIYTILFILGLLAGGPIRVFGDWNRSTFKQFIVAAVFKARWKNKLILIIWFGLYWGIFLIFYAGSYYYGNDDRFSLLCYVPLALLAGVGVEMIERLVAVKMPMRGARTLLLCTLVIVFSRYISVVSAVKDGAWLSRADHEFALEFAKTLPPESVLISHNPAIFNMHYKSSMLASFIFGHQDRLEQIVRERPGQVYLHWGYWAVVPDALQNRFSNTVREQFECTEVDSRTVRNPASPNDKYTFRFYRMAMRQK